MSLGAPRLCPTLAPDLICPQPCSTCSQEGVSLFLWSEGALKIEDPGQVTFGDGLNWRDNSGLGCMRE